MWSKNLHLAADRLERLHRADVCVPSSEPATIHPDALMNHLEAAWGVIANVSESDWKKQTCEWQDAAKRWRDVWHSILDATKRAREIQDETRRAARFARDANGPTALVERVAQAIYDAGRVHDPEGKDRPWVPYGNSHKQDEARRKAREVLDAGPTALDELDTPTRRELDIIAMTIDAAEQVLASASWTFVMPGSHEPPVTVPRSTMSRLKEAIDTTNVVAWARNWRNVRNTRAHGND